MLIPGLFSLFACTGNATKDKEQVENSTETHEQEKINDCKEFLGKYEIWSIDYIALLESFAAMTSLRGSR